MSVAQPSRRESVGPAVRGATRGVPDEVGVPSPDLVEAFDECLASLGSLTPDWIAPGVVDAPRRLEPRRVVEVGRKACIFALLLALCGAVGWLTVVLISAIAN